MIRTVFDLSFSEVGIILVVAILVLKPEDLPVVMNKIGRFIRSIKAYISDLDFELKNPPSDKNNIKIIDLDGIERETYDLKDIKDTSRIVKEPLDNPELLK
jgi:Sec-independent protein translocase protein TatA